MAIYKDTPTWEEDVLIVDTSTPMLGGQPEWDGTQLTGGYSNISAAILANRTRYLKNGVEAVLGSLEGEVAKLLVAANNLDDLENTQQAKANLGLNLVDNTHDVDKPISDATQLALDDKVDKESGKGLSEEDFTSLLKSKLDGVAENATNTADPVNADWDSTTGLSEIQNKPTFKTVNGESVIGSGNIDTPNTEYTAGDNIDITGGVISASSTEYTKITASEMWTGTATTARAIAAEDINQYGEFIALSGSPVAVDMSTGRNFKLGVSANVTISKPTNLKEGQTGDIVITLSANATVAWNAAWNFISAVPDIGKEDEVWVMSYKVFDADTVIITGDKLA